MAAIVAVGAIRLVRRPSMYTLGTIVPALDVLTQLVLIAFGFALLVSPGSVLKGTSLGTAPTVSSLVFAIPLAMLAFTGLETVANLAEEARRPGVDLPRALFLAIGTVVTAYVAIAIVGLSAFPGPHTELGTTWLRSPLVGVADQIRAHTNRTLGDTIRFFVGVSGALILLASVTTSISGFCRLAYSLGEHGQLPRVFGRLHRRTLVSPQAIIAVTTISSAIVIASAFLRHDVAFLASMFSFGVLLAFTATQIAVIKLRVTAPDLPRPYRTPLNITIRGAEIPLPAIVGAILTFAVWVIAIVTHPGARYGGPAWLLVGLVVFVAVRRSHGEGLTQRVTAPDTIRFDDVPRFRRVLVPMKLGVIGEEMAATAVKLAAEHRATVEALPRRMRPPRSAPRCRHGRSRRPGRRIPRRGDRARGRARRRGQVGDDPQPRDRPGDRRPRTGVERRPDRPRLLAALAPAVTFLLPHRRLRPPPGALRGARRRLPAAGARRGGRPWLIAPRPN